MGANSALRKAAKTVLYPLANETTYKYFQAISKAWDIRNGSWFEPELDLVSMGLRAGETALDIGANYGLYTHHMSKAVGREGSIYSFEPVPFTYASLKVVGKILGFPKNVRMIGKGCSDENSTIKFSVPVQASGASAAGLSFVTGRDDDRNGKETQVRWAATKEVEAEVVRLDDFLPELADVAMVKIDIEGAELSCLRGAEQLFARHLPTTICEINPWYLEGFGVAVDDLTRFFTDKGYEIYFYTDEGGQKKLRRIEPSEIVEDNYVFIHPKRSERFAKFLPNVIS